jgi:hypothetical protein
LSERITFERICFGYIIIAETGYLGLPVLKAEINEGTYGSGAYLEGGK